MQTEDLKAVKLLAQWWGDAEIIETLKDGAVSAGMKFIISVAQNQGLCKHVRMPRRRQRCTRANYEVALKPNTNGERPIPCVGDSS